MGQELASCPPLGLLVPEVEEVSGDGVDPGQLQAKGGPNMLPKPADLSIEGKLCLGHDLMALLRERG